MSLVDKSLDVERSGLAVSIGHLILRVLAGLMIFYVHGWNKLEGLMAYLQHGTPWKLTQEVAESASPSLPSRMQVTAFPWQETIVLPGLKRVQ